MWQQALDIMTAENWNSYITHTEECIDEALNQELLLDTSEIQPLIDIGEDSDSKSEHMDSE